MIRYSTQPGSPVVEITVEGTVTRPDLEAVIKGVQAGIDQDGKTRIIEIIQHFTGIELSAIWTDIRLGVPLGQKVDRVAVVADQTWIRQLAELGHLFTRAELKVFAPAELERARAWIAAD
ncbi:MAG TPA: STAS/SEC14 domain-containing protein [Caulobacteraceae bacterium]